jgi:sugar phosphate isomerase/epimerase
VDRDGPRVAGRGAGSANLRHGVTGRSLNNYDAIFQILAEHHYRGWISIEDGMNGLEEMRESLEFLQQMVDRYYAEEY